MKKILLSIILVSLMVFACSKEDKKGDVSGKITFMRGKVEKSQDGADWKKVSINEKVIALDWIQTANEKKSMATVAIWKSTQFTIGSNSKVQVIELTKDNQFNMKYTLGRISCYVEDLSEKEAYFRVQGLAIVVGVRGTEFDLYSDGKKEVLKVNKGSVAVKRNIEGAPEKLVTAGKGIVVSVSENEKLKKEIQGKKKEEIEKILDIPLKDKKIIEQEFPPEIKKEIKEHEKFTEKQEKKIESLEKKQEKSIKKTIKDQEKSIDKLKKDAFGDKDATDMSADDLLKKSKKKKKNK